MKTGSTSTRIFFFFLTLQACFVAHGVMSAEDGAAVPTAEAAQQNREQRLRSDDGKRLLSPGGASLSASLISNRNTERARRLLVIRKITDGVT